MNPIKAWLSAMRLRTLPLALSSIVLGSYLSTLSANFDLPTAILAGITTVLLQILSNLANDYGDFVSGVDLKDRVGPKRALQSGAITKSSMKAALFLFAALALASGIALLLRAWSRGLENEFFVFLALGIGAIAAAIMYTVGKKPYGYMGLGDVFVFLFFGLVGVGGSFYLASGGLWHWSILLPASAIGLLSAAVLNLNNLRDAEKDAAAGKRTLVVILGRSRAINYHQFLLFIPFVLMAAFFFNRQVPMQYHYYLVAMPILGTNALKVLRTPDLSTLDPELKKVAIGTFLFAVLSGVGWHWWLNA
jgi:1,4-dihydroxy-2-naphthoate octaprenyltransferase